jgi:YHS domain-containing protein
VNDKENVYAAWFTGSQKRGVYYCELNNNEEAVFKKLISPNGKNIQLCLAPDGSKVLAYNEIRRQPARPVGGADSFYSKIVVNKIEGKKVLEANITSSKAHAGYPVIHAMKKNNIAVAWTEDDKVFYTLLNTHDISNTIQPSPIMPVATENKLLHVKLDYEKDPVCGMPLSHGAKDTTSYNKKIIGFCSDGCKEQFLKNPKQYAIKLGKEL